MKSLCTWSLAAAILGLSTQVFGQAAPPAAAPGGGAPVALAGKYKYLVPSPTLATSKIEEAKIRTQVRNVLVGSPGFQLADNRVLFDNYYLKFYFPMMTQLSDKALENLPVDRQRFFRDHLETCTVPEVHAHLLNLTLTQMTAIVEDSFHPAVRYNAMLIISQLNDQDPVRVGASRATPEPMLRALPVILTQFQNPDHTDAVRVAALLGLVRHLEWDNFRGDPAAPVPAIAPPVRAAVVKALLDVATMKEPPQGRSPEGHEWFRRRAIEGLAHAGYLKADATVVAALESLLKDEAESVAIRCAAASAVGKMAYQAPVKVDPTPTAKELGYLALVACDKELTRLSELKEQEEERAIRLQQGVTPGMQGGYTMPTDSAQAGPTIVRNLPKSNQGSGQSGYPSSGYPSSGYPTEGYGSGTMGELVPADPKQYRFDPVRRRIRAFLYSVQVGLGGPEKDTVRGLDKIAKAPADAKYVADVRAAVDKLARIVEESETDLATLEKDLREGMKPLEAITRKLGAVATPAVSDIPGGDIPGPAPAPKTPAAPAPPAPAGDTPMAPPVSAADTPMPPAGPITPAAPMRPAAAPMTAPPTPMPGAAPATPAPMSPAG